MRPLTNDELQELARSSWRPSGGWSYVDGVFVLSAKEGTIWWGDGWWPVKILASIFTTVILVDECSWSRAKSRYSWLYQFSLWVRDIPYRWSVFWWSWSLRSLHRDLWCLVWHHEPFENGYTYDTDYGQESDVWWECRRCGNYLPLGDP